MGKPPATVAIPCALAAAGLTLYQAAMTTLEADPALKAEARQQVAAPPTLVERATVLLAVAAIAAGCLARFFIAGHQPLWLDETWTGAIAMQHGLGAVFQQIWWDVNAPFYYLFAHLWSQVAGLSDPALRLPSAVFGGVAAVVVALRPVQGLPRGARLTWAALLAVWIPGVWFSGDARCYALLLMLATLQTLAFVRLLQAPDLKRAAVWAGLGALSILTHYHAVFLGAFQGLAYLAYARGKAVRTWPAALLFVPAFAWIAIHLPRIQDFARPDIVWYSPLTFERLPRAALRFLAGTDEVAIGLAVAGVAALALGFLLKPKGRREPWPVDQALWIAAGTALLGAMAVIALGFFRASFVDRYLFPFMPGLFLGLAMIAQALARRWSLAYAAVILAFAIPAVPWARTQVQHGWRFYNFEVASTELMKNDPQRLVFFWDHPAGPVEAPGQLDAVGGFFFRRAGHPIAVTPVILKPGEEPNARLLADAKEPRTAILWMYDIGVRGTAARSHKPALDTLDPTLKCRQLGSGSIGILACDRGPEAKP